MGTSRGSRTSGGAGLRRRGIVCARPRYAATSFRSRGTDSDRTTSSRILAGLRPGASQSAPGRRRSDDYFFTPRSASASLALARESACLPLSCRLCASLSLATAPFTLGSFWSIFAAASRPSLITFGHELASATPLVSARLTATAVTVRSFLIRNSPPRDTRGFYQQSTAIGCGGSPAVDSVDSASTAVGGWK